jgi:hypothetical protein
VDPAFARMTTGWFHERSWVSGGQLTATFGKKLAALGRIDDFRDSQ